MRYIYFILMFYCSVSVAQPTLKISGIAWQSLSSDERSVIQQKYVIETVNADSFGTIIDNQGADRSTAGTNAGAVLGEAIASANYIDKSIGNGNYSAKNHLGLMLLGSLLGATLDAKPQSQYQFRYAIRLGNGSVIYQDIFSSEPFRHSVGVCVFVPAINIVPEQHLCTQTAESLRVTHIVPVEQFRMEISQKEMLPLKGVDPMASEIISNSVRTELINCKINNLTPVKASLEKCKLINGVILND